MALLKQGIERWEDILKKRKKDIQSLRSRNEKRGKGGKGDGDA
jgi:hypothetical protein